MNTRNATTIGRKQNNSKKIIALVISLLSIIMEITGFIMIVVTSKDSIYQWGGALFLLFPGILINIISTGIYASLKGYNEWYIRLLSIFYILFLPDRRSEEE